MSEETDWGNIEGHGLLQDFDLEDFEAWLEARTIRCVRRRALESAQEEEQAQDGCECTVEGLFRSYIQERNRGAREKAAVKKTVTALFQSSPCTAKHK